MKYIVELKYTNPSHEHVSLRRRVESRNAIVEAANEEEAILRASRQQRALGFMVQEAKIVEQKKNLTEEVELDEAKHLPHLATFVPKKDSKIAKDHISIPVHSDHGPKSHKDKFAKIFGKDIASEYTLHKVTERTNEEVEQIDEMKAGKEYSKKELEDKMKSGNWEANYDVKPGKHVEMRHRSGKTVTVMVKNVKEEAEQIDELKKSTLASYATKAATNVRTATNLARGFENQKYSAMKRSNDNSPYNKNRKKKDPQEYEAATTDMNHAEKLQRYFERRAKKRITGIGLAAAKLAKEEAEQVEEARSEVPDKFKHLLPSDTKLPQIKVPKKPGPSKIRKGGPIGSLKGYDRWVSGSTEAPSSKVRKEEVEQIDELKKSTLASYVKKATRDVASASRLQRGYEMDAARKGDAANYVARGSDLAAKAMRKLAAKRSTGVAKAVDKLAKEEVEQVDEARPGWMLKHPDGAKLAAVLKAKKELARKRRKAYGDPSAGVSVKKEEVEAVEEKYQVVATTKAGEQMKSGTYPTKKAAQSMHWKLAKGNKHKDVRIVAKEEQIDEAGETSLKLSQLAKQKATDLERYPSKDGSLGRLRKNPDKQKIRGLRDLANKAYARSINPTGAPTGNVEGGGHKSLRRQGATDKDIPPSPMNMSKLMGYFKEEVQYIEEKLTAADPASKWISDFVHSDNPKFAGKSKKERIRMALGAHYAAKREKNEEIVTEAEREAGYKMPAHVAAAQKKSDELSKIEKPAQAGTLAASKKKVVSGINKKEVDSDENIQNRRQGTINKINLNPEMSHTSAFGVSNVKF